MSQLELHKRTVHRDGARIAQILLNNRRYNILLKASRFRLFGGYEIRIEVLDFRSEKVIAGGIIQLDGLPPFDVEHGVMPGKGILLKVNREFVGHGFQYSEVY